MQAPWSNQIVRMLNEYQKIDKFHSYTCADDSQNHPSLKATTEGWICPDKNCDYTQDWCHAITISEMSNREIMKNKGSKKHQRDQIS